MLVIKENNKSKGMTYIEVAVCLFVMAIIVTPLCITLLTATQIRTGAEAIRESTFNAESLMADIKFQMTKDITLKIKKEGKEMAPATSALIGNRLDYLSTTTPAHTEIDLSVFLETIADSKRKYNTTRYAYEIAIWKDKHLTAIPSAGVALEMNQTTLLDAVRIYSTSEQGLCFDSYTASDKTVRFTMEKNLAQVSKDTLYIDRFIPAHMAANAAYEIIDARTIAIHRDAVLGTVQSVSIPSERGGLGIETKVIRNYRGQVKGYTYEMNTLEGYVPKDETLPLYGNIILDLRQILRDDFTDELAFKFINQTDHLMNIKILRNVKEEDGETFERIDDKIHKQFSVIGENKTALGKINIERIDDKILQNNYIIVIIVREKEPSFGERGKIIKKMVDVYSYTPSKG